MSEPLKFGERDSLGYTRHCSRCKKYAPESWHSGLCNDCYRDHSERLEQQRRDDEQARWDALKAERDAARAERDGLRARIEKLIDRTPRNGFGDDRWVDADDLRALLDQPADDDEATS